MAILSTSRLKLPYTDNEAINQALDILDRAVATLQDGGDGGGTVFPPRQTGTVGKEIWSLFPDGIIAISGTGLFGPDFLIAYPFSVAADVTMDRIAIQVIGSPGSTSRAGVYQSTSATNIYPDALVAGSDTGEMNVDTTGVKTATVAAALTAGRLYWLTITNGPSDVTYRVVSDVLKLWPPNGGTPTSLLTGRYALSVTSAYGPLPATFPAAASLIGGSNPIMAARFAA